MYIYIVNVHIYVKGFIYLFLKIIYLFIFGCVGSSLQCTGFSLQWFLLLRSMGCRRAGFSSCGMQAQ